jgi:hypothetical protein
MTEPSPDHEARITLLVRRWKDANRGRLEAEAALRRACTELLNAANELGRSLEPTDAKPGEIFSVWIGGELVQATVPATGSDYEIKTRPGKKSARSA